MAPAAKLAIYKVCWATAEDGSAGCDTSDSVAAIDAAVADGVDVINYSISGSRVSSVDPVERGVLPRRAGRCLRRGRRRATTGPARARSRITSRGSLRSPPAHTTAAPRPPVHLGNAEERDGRSGSARSRARRSYSSTAVARKAPPTQAVHARAPSIPAKIAGKIVVCDRGVTRVTRRAWSSGTPAASAWCCQHVAELGQRRPALRADRPPRPRRGRRVKAYAAGADATASLTRV